MSGFMTRPAFTPRERISLKTVAGSSVAFRWNDIIEAPTFANLSTYFSGFTIIRCTSRGFTAIEDIASTTGKP